MASFYTRRAVVLLGLAAALISALMITVYAVGQPSVSAVDRTVFDAVRTADSGVMDVAMRAATVAGDVLALAFVVLLLAVFCFQRRERHNAALVVGAGAMTFVLNTGLKTFFARARPDELLKIEAPASFSFPSGHAMGSLIVYGLVAAVLGAAYPRWRAALWVTAPLLIFCIGLSRVYLGVHWATDVVGGYLTGGLVLLAATVSLRKPLS